MHAWRQGAGPWEMPVAPTVFCHSRQRWESQFWYNEPQKDMLPNTSVGFGTKPWSLGANPGRRFGSGEGRRAYSRQKPRAIESSGTVAF